MTVNRAIGWEMEGMPRIVRGEGSYLIRCGRQALSGRLRRAGRILSRDMEIAR